MRGRLDIQPVALQLNVRCRQPFVSASNHPTSDHDAEIQLQNIRLGNSVERSKLQATHRGLDSARSSKS
jgi:hypothetical protein